MSQKIKLLKSDIDPKSTEKPVQSTALNKSQSQSESIKQAKLTDSDKLKNCKSSSTLSKLAKHDTAIVSKTSQLLKYKSWRPQKLPGSSNKASEKSSRSNSRSKPRSAKDRPSSANKSNKNKLRKNKPPTPKSNKISNSNKFNNKNTKNGFKSKYLNCKDSREHI